MATARVRGTWWWTLGFLLSAAGSGTLGIGFLLIFLGRLSADHLSGRQIFVTITYLVATFLALAGALTLTVMQRTATSLTRARKVANVTLGCLIVSLAFSVFAFGMSWILLIYVYQLGWLAFFQLTTDPNLDRRRHFHSPWEPNPQEKKKGYIALNFFNIFWVFVVASVVGLLVEDIWHIMLHGHYEDRAGLVWGPFSTIYGFGAVLMTMALNRFWNRSPFLIFAVAAVIGAAFEFWMSFFLQTAFGIVAWDYSGTFLNIDGRTNFAFGCAWGFLGLVWIKILLPGVLRVVDAIPLKVRTVVTVLAAIFMLLDNTVTLVALDCWYQREAGKPQTTAVQQYFGEHFDNAYMTHRFQTMTVNPSSAGRVAS